MVLGNTFHLFLVARPRADPPARRAAPLHALGAADHHRLRRLPGLLDGPRHGGRRDQGPPGARRAHGLDPRDRRGRACASAPTSTAPSSSWRPRPRWRSRPRWAPTSRSCSTSARRSTSRATTRRARPSAPTAGSTAAWPGTPSTGRTTSSSTGSSRAGWRRTCGASRPRRSPPAARAGSRSAARSGEDKPQMYEVVEWAVAELPEQRPRHLLGIGEIDDLLRGVELGIDTFDCAMPTRIGRHGMAIVPDPAQRWRVDLAKGRYREADEPMLEGCPCPACARGLLARLPALPAQGPRVDRLAAADDPQPRLPAAADGGAARRRSPRDGSPRRPRRCAGARRRGSSQRRIEGSGSADECTR